MNRFIIVAVCICKFTFKALDNFYNYTIVLVSGVLGGYIDSSSHHGSGKGFSAGSGLKSIAEGSAQQANNAVANQHAAARQAVFSAKSSLAQAAIGVSSMQASKKKRTLIFAFFQAAATAQAALIGKQILVQKLERDVNEAHQQLQGELHQLEQAERSASASQQALEQAQRQVNALNSALNTAQGAGSHAQQAAEEALAELGSQEAMVGAAKQRLASLTQELAAAEGDLQATQAAAHQAESAAHIAQSNAASAAESASAAGLEHGGSYGGASYEYGAGDYSEYHH